MANGAEVQEERRSTRVFSEADVRAIVKHYVEEQRSGTLRAWALDESIEAVGSELTEEVIARSCVERMLREAVLCGRAGHGVPEPGDGVSLFLDRMRARCG